jgi:FlaA1/EpsC-like NDP-sugar epimerase
MIFNTSCSRKPVVAVDDDKKKNGRSIYGVKIGGSIDMIPALVKKYSIEDIVFAIPSADKNQRRKILKICSDTGCNLMLMPSVTKLSDYRNLQERLRPVNIEDLLGRDEVDLDISSISDYFKSKTILITGGGGSIGSELARQVIKFDPAGLVIMDIYENSVYRLLNELNFDDPKTGINVEIGSIRDIKRLESVFSSYRPDVVFHAAAHKHVPFMEDCPFEAVKNNILGTLNTAKMADKYNTSRFVMISTDKAVNPTSVMGATKRVAEMIVQSMDKISKTEFAAVRFGNVLGSNGSVIPLFRTQIEKGGPVTVTHQDIKRFFMTASEAAKLVIQAGAIAKGGEVFILDMGELIKIIDLARNLISLSGFIPDEDIKIEITGLRPGEKMFEEVLLDEEGVEKTCHDKILIGKSKHISYEKLMENIDMMAASICDEDRLRKILAEIVPTYKNR